jgi:hypothetical protein
MLHPMNSKYSMFGPAVAVGLFVCALLASAASGCANGQTGSIGMSECSTDADCDESLRSWALELARPLDSVPQLYAASCEERNVFTDDWHTGPVCECVGPRGVPPIWVGPSGLGCLVGGRLKTCVYADSEFPGCVVGDLDSCKEVCATVEERLVGDSTIEYSVTPRMAECRGSLCASVVQIGERCFTGVTMGSPSGSYDCSLSDEEILSRQAQADIQDSARP